MPRGVDRYDDALRQGRLWTPRDLGSTLAGWWDMTDFATITADSSGFIGTVTDKSGSGRNATQATLGAKMIFLPASSEGSRRAAGSGTISGHAFTQLAIPSLASTGWTAAEMFYVIRRDSQLDTGAGVIGTFGQTGMANTHEPFTDGLIYAGGFSTTRATGFTPTKAYDTAIRIVNQRCITGSWQYLIDGTIESSQVLTFVAPAAPVLGSDGNTLNGKFFEALLIGGRKLTTRESDAMVGYLAWKHRITANLTAAQPFKNRPPLIGD